MVHPISTRGSTEMESERTKEPEEQRKTDGGTLWAVMPYGGNFLAVGGFSLFGGNDFGGGGKTKVWR